MQKANAFHYNKNCFKLRKELNNNMLCGVVPAWLPWKLNKVAEWCYYGYQLLCLILFVTPAAAITLLVWEVSTWIIMHTEVLKQSFEGILRIADIQERRRRLNLWLSYHLHILSLSRQLNYLTKKCLGIYSLLAALLFGSVINQIHNKENTVGGTLTFLGFLLAIFILCQAGEKISQQNKDITDAVYNSSWYMMEVKTRKDVMFILMSSNIKLYLEALPLGQLNFALLLMVYMYI
ncbi:odorant receptor 82a-like [Diabrotica undecimpunctata]|uniref:odorant receptor 82a-like n=1 Tax=Diabrotica undecimpunctata TaxID=50387 RepID=UPI003B63E4EA